MAANNGKTNGRTPAKRFKNVVPEPPKPTLDDKIAAARKQVELRLLENAFSLMAPVGSVKAELDYLNDQIGWEPIGTGGVDRQDAIKTGFRTEHDLFSMIARSRIQASDNPFAANLFQNRINYIIGDNPKISVIPTTPEAKKKKKNVNTAKEFENFLTLWQLVNNFEERREELVLRGDRDGDIAVRWFYDPDGMTHFRFVEPLQIKNPANRSVSTRGEVFDEIEERRTRFGVRSDPDDVMIVEGYYVHYSDDSEDWEFVPAEDMMLFKFNVDENSPRGRPLTYPARDELDHAKRGLRNLMVTSTMQAAVSMIRTHDTGKPDVVKDFVSSQKTISSRAASPATNDVMAMLDSVVRAGMPHIVDVTKGTKVEFPATMIDVEKMVAAVEAAVSAVAAAVQMPNWMLTSVAGSTNYANALVSEAPSTRAFLRAQKKYRAVILHFFAKALIHAMERGLVRQVDELELVSEIGDKVIFLTIGVSSEFPNLVVRDRLNETRRYRVLAHDGILSRETWSDREGEDFDQEQHFIEEDPDHPFNRAIQQADAALEAQASAGADGGKPINGKNNNQKPPKTAEQRATSAAGGDDTLD